MEGGGWRLDKPEHTPVAELGRFSGDRHGLYQARTCRIPSRSWIRSVSLVLPLLTEKAIPESISFTLLSSKVKCCMSTSGWNSLHPRCKKDWKTNCLDSP